MGACAYCEETASREANESRIFANDMVSLSELSTPLLKPELKQTSIENQLGQSPEKFGMSSGVIEPQQYPLESRKKVDEFSGPICSVCNGGMRGWGLWCTVCGHGGHPEEILSWFDYGGADFKRLLQLEKTLYGCNQQLESDKIKTCPSGCGCRCFAFNTKV